MSQPAVVQRYGSFVRGALQLALPMEALREVVPCPRPMALPSDAPGLIGGIDLRGVVVPVLDLQRLLGVEAAASERPCVIVMVHEGTILGLLADSVGSVFAAEPSRLAQVRTSGTLPLLFSACLQVDDAQRVSVLDPAALAALPQLPRVCDPEPGRQMQHGEATPDADAADAAVAAAGTTAVPMMLVRCGAITLAIDAIAVHCTLANPVLRDSVLARGACRGVLDHGGEEVPALDLLALCGIGPQAPAASRQAFVMRLGGGSVAFLVDAVLDIVPTTAADVMALPAFALPRPQLFAGVLPASLVPGMEPAAQPGMAAPCLLLHSAALCADDEVQALASLRSTADAKGGRAGAAGAASPERTMLTYDLDVEIATPLEQVSEILPYAPATSVLGHGGPVMGVMVNRGRSIPVLSLGQLHAASDWAPGPSASVLVVESGDDLVGFAVAGLKAIEPSAWQPTLQHGGLSGGSRPMALVGEGAQQRMLPVLDLRQLAQGLRQAA